VTRAPEIVESYETDVTLRQPAEVLPNRVRDAFGANRGSEARGRFTQARALFEAVASADARRRV
jgi:hypothetical protein